jgi:predicted MFS family arabinose efflux permease
MSDDKSSSLVAALLLGCVGVFAIMAGPIIKTVLVAGLGMTDADASLIVGFEQLGTALGPVAAAFWMPRMRWRTAAIVALLVIVVGNMVSSYQSSVGVLTALRFVVGLMGQGTAFALAIGIISNSTQKDRNFAFLIAAQVVLGVLFFLVLPLPRDGGIGGVLVPLAALALLTLLTAGMIRNPGESSGHGATGPGSKGPVRPAVVALVVMLIWCTGLGAIWNNVGLIGASAGIDPARVGVALGVSTGVATAGALAASWLADRAGRLLPVAVGLLVQVAMIFLLQGQMSFGQFLLTAAVFQSFWNLTGPYMMGTIALSDTSGRVSVLIPTAQIGGFSLGNFIVPPLLTAGEGYAPANMVAIACCLLALALFVPTALRLDRQLRGT